MTKKINPTLKANKSKNKPKPTLKKNQKTNPETKSFKKVLAEIESPQDWGNGSWALPENPTALKLKAKELADRQGQIRALETKLNEKENNSPWQTKINKLEFKLNLVKKQLTKWKKLLTKYD